MLPSRTPSCDPASTFRALRTGSPFLGMLVEEPRGGPARKEENQPRNPFAVVGDPRETEPSCSPKQRQRLRVDI